MVPAICHRTALLLEILWPISAADYPADMPNWIYYTPIETVESYDFGSGVSDAPHARPSEGSRGVAMIEAVVVD